MAAADVLTRADAAVGSAVEGYLRLHHRRRLARLGQLHTLDPTDDGPFAAGDPPPRPGCRVEVLVDGADALPRIAEALRGARSHVHVTGWHVRGAFELERGEDPTVLGELLAELAERIDVRVMVWAGAPVPVFHPTRSEVEREVERLVRGTRIRCERDPREHPVHCHHEKTIVIDDEIAFVGGIDLTDLAGDRFDRRDHPARRRLGWHDGTTRRGGTGVGDGARHFTMRWHEVTREGLPAPRETAPLAGERASTVQVVRTVAEDMYDAVPRGDF